MRCALPLWALLAVGCLLPPSVSRAQTNPVSQRDITIAEKARRPEDPWPRGDGHVVLGEPGSPVSQKAYHEPGGSFTPSPGSFGVALWIRDEAGRLLGTSDTIPMANIQQRYVELADSKIPAIEDTTPYYTCTWSYSGPGQWKLQVRNGPDDHRIEVVFRSVGPAGGLLNSVIWDGSRLLLNRRWLVNSVTPLSSVVVGDETRGGLINQKSDDRSIASETGWGFARLAAMGSSCTLTLTDTRPQFASQLSYQKLEPQFGFRVPDKRFEESLRAQVITLMMGYVGRQTGPGEPINYPLAWERDGAYSLMAMAKAGQLQTAKELSVYFAENDYFGGFGAEGDAPSSAINALCEVAGLVQDPSYDQWLWPHLARKLRLINEMLTATNDVYKEYVGPLAPRLANGGRRHQMICRPAEGGLIVGSMDLHFPVIYINALAYRGLIQASRLATRLGKADVAADCVAKAKGMRAAWTANFTNPKYDNERNFMITIWPSWIINQDFKPFVDKMESNRQRLWAAGRPKERPLWTYFTTSEAHQWLFLEKTDRTWETLEYFFANQCAPGLYSYWEGEGEENTFHQWEQYRGWLKPKYVTPHYWTASEMLHLQIDMLAYIDESGDNFEIVLGGGVPAAWLRQPMFLQNFRTKAGVLSWEYKDGTMKATVARADQHYSVRLGPAFRDKQIKLEVSYP